MKTVCPQAEWTSKAVCASGRRDAPACFRTLLDGQSLVTGVGIEADPLCAGMPPLRRFVAASQTVKCPSRDTAGDGIPVGSVAESPCETDSLSEQPA